MRRLAQGLIFAGLLLARFCHLDIVWVEEGYPTAAAIQLLHGKSLYQDIWFDKPPLFPYVYLLWGAHTGWPLRLAGASFVFLCCLLLYGFAADLWSEREGLAASSLLAFYLTFGIPSAVMALAPDLLLIAPHIAALWLASRGKPFWAGLAAGSGMLLNTKAVFVLLACLFWSRTAWPLLLAGFALPNLAVFGWFGRPYYEEVWRWGAVYSQHGFSWVEGLRRTTNWLGFQAALVLGVMVYVVRSGVPKERTRMLAWVLLSLAAVAAGWRFFPRYYFQLLVPMVLLASRGFVLLERRRWVMLALMAIPLVHFGPRYVTLAGDLLRQRPHTWSDLQLSQDSEAASRLIADRGATLLVWGYRPDVFALTRMRAGTRFLDSQPLTGVIADRHLTSSQVAYPELAAHNRSELVLTNPTYIVDGLGLLNPSLAIDNYPDLREWLSHYREIGRTPLSIVYRTINPSRD